MVRGHLQNEVTVPQFDLFITFKSVKIIQEKLEVKYEVHDAEKKNYMVGNWLQFQNTDDKPIIEYVHVYKNPCVEA